MVAMPDTSNFAHPPRNVGAMHIEQGMYVADFGAGSGAYVLALAEVVGTTGKVYAIDVQKDLLRRIQNEASKRGLHNVEILWGDVELETGSKIVEAHVDCVLISNLLFQITGKGCVFQEAKRILKEGGRLIVIDWSESFNGMGPPSSDVVTKNKTLSLALAHGFELKEEFDAGAHHYGIILKQKV